MSSLSTQRLTRRGFALTAIAGLAVTAACGNGVGTTNAATIDARVDATLNQMYVEYPNTVTLAEKSTGMLIMPAASTIKLPCFMLLTFIICLSLP